MRGAPLNLTRPCCRSRRCTRQSGLRSSASNRVRERANGVQTPPLSSLVLLPAVRRWPLRRMFTEDELSKGNKIIRLLFTTPPCRNQRDVRESLLALYITLHTD